MGTAAFDAAWDTPHGDALDAVWDAPHVNAAEKLHAEYKKGLLGGRMQRENANDMERATAEDAAAPSPSYGEGARALWNDPGQIPAAAGKAFVATGANAARGIPGATALEAGVRSYAQNQPYREALGDVEGATGNIPDYLRGAERIAGATGLGGIKVGALASKVPVVGNILAGAAGKIGATSGYMAADQALSANPDESLGQRALKTAAAGVGGKALGVLGGGIANVAQRTGLTDAVAGGLSKLGGKAASVAEAIGTKGAGNQLLGQRQQVQDELAGSEQSAAQTMLDHGENYKTLAKQFYGVAKQDTKVISDPRVVQHLQDPDVKMALSLARQAIGNQPAETATAPAIEASVAHQPRDAVADLQGQLATETDPAQRAEVQRLLSMVEKTRAETPEVAPPTPSREPEAFSQDVKMAPTHADPMDRATALGHLLEQRDAGAPVAAQIERIRNGYERPPSYGGSATSLPATNGAIVQRPVASPPQSTDLPTPEEVAVAKRLLYAVAQRKFNAPTGIDPVVAARMLPKIDDLRNSLHDASPDWKQADAFTTNAKNFELAYQKAFGVQQKVTAAGLDPNKLKTPDAMNAWVAKGNGSTGIARASGQQAGAAGRINEAVRNAPLGTDIAETLKGANGVFQPSETAAAIRRPAFGSPEAAQQFSELIGGLTAKAEGTKFGPTDWKPSVNPFTLFGAGKSQNPLATPAGGELRMKLSSMLADPKQATQLRAQLSQSKEGQALLQQILRMSMGAGNAMMGTH